ncbi:hypothetical protein L208DRAFT_1374176 [Tricholoma matsutake]|nr:hypothetical protein L208DRAFT_1374176 [Tricholoma matsutake 945]
MEVLFNDPENMDIKMTSTIVDNKSQGMRDNAQNWGDIRHIESIKEQANTQFKSEEYVKAIEAYTKALGFSSAPVETRHTLLSNQAQFPEEHYSQASLLSSQDFKNFEGLKWDPLTAAKKKLKKDIQVTGESEGKS